MRTTVHAMLVLAVVLLAGPLAAETLSLEQAMARGREHAWQVAAARARTRASEERVSQARSWRLPKLSAHEIWMRTDSPADVFGLQLQQERFSFDDFVAGDPNDPDALTNALTRFEATLPIYTGGELSNRIRQARLAADAAGIEAGWAEDQAALAAAEAFVRLAQAREGVRILEASMETVDTHVRLAAAYVEQGMIVRSELLRAEVERSRIADMLSEARGMARVAEVDLSFQMAAAADTAWEIEPLEAPQMLSGDLAAWLAGVDERGDLQAARLMLKAGELEVRVRRAGQMPKLGVAARYDLNDDVLFGSNGQSAAVMAMLSIDLFSGGRNRAAKAEAQARVELAAAEIARAARGARLEVRDAYEQSQTSRERHRTAVAAREAAVEAERIVEVRFEQGVVKIIDLLDASTARLEAQARELMARTESHLADLRLALSSGHAPESVLVATADPTGQPVGTKEDGR